MARLSAKQIGVLVAYHNWGPGPMGVSIPEAKKFLDTAIAVAMAESGGDTNVISSTGDYGLWQINREAHPQYFTGGNPRDAHFKIFDPLYNTECAERIWLGAGKKWSPWAAYNNGSYKRYMGQGDRVYRYIHGLSKAQLQAAVKAVPGVNALGNPDAGFQDSLEAAPDQLPGIVSDLGNKIIAGGKVAGFFLLAVVILIIGVLFLLKDTSIGKTAVSLVNPAKKIKALTK